jgi:hypothetical protein
MRPLDPLCLDYACFDIMQIRAMYKKFQPSLRNGMRNIKAESKRYVEVYGDERKIHGAQFFDHGILPQEILERSEMKKSSYDRLGTRMCAGCRRQLHQDSFSRPFARWSPGTYCHTCTRVREFDSARDYRF